MVTHLCTAYSILIVSLITNTEDATILKAAKAIEAVKEYAAQTHVDQMVRDFINEA